MEICVLNPFFYPFKGGTEKVIYEVYTRLAKRHNITVITSSDPGKKSSRDEIGGINVVRLRANRISVPGLPLPFVNFDGLNRQIRKTSAEVYHINNRYQYFYFNVRAMKSMGRLALTIHNSLPQNIGAATDTAGLIYDSLWGRSIMREADLITAVSGHAMEVTVPKEYRGKAHVVYNGVDSKNFRRISKSDKNVRRLIHRFGLEGTTIMCNGRLVPQKGQIYLLKALAELEGRGTKTNLLLLGRGPMEGNLHKSAIALGLSKMVITGGIGDDKLPYYYAMSDISVIPSLYEPASLAALESMACELPVIATRVGGLPEMVGPCGIYVEPRDHTAVMNAIQKLLDNRKLARKMGTSGRARVIRRNCWDDIARQYESLFLNLTKH